LAEQLKTDETETNRNAFIGFVKEPF